MDILSDFFESCVSVEANKTVTIGALYDAYIAFCEATGEGPKERLGKKKFNQRVEERGFDRYKPKNVPTWIGLEIRE